MSNFDKAETSARSAASAGMVAGGSGLQRLRLRAQAPAVLAPHHIPRSRPSASHFSHLTVVASLSSAPSLTTLVWPHYLHFGTIIRPTFTHMI